VRHTGCGGGDPANAYNFRQMSGPAPSNEELQTAVAMIRDGRSLNAIPILDGLIEFDSSNCLALRERGVAKKFCGDHAGAITDFTEVIRQQPANPEGYTDRADARRRAGDLHGALEDYSAAISLDPKHAFAYLARGRVRVECGDFCGAMTDFTADMVNSNMGQLSGLLNRGRVKHRLGDLAGAVSDLTEAMHLEKGQAIFAPLFRGRVRLEMGNYEAAIADFTASIEAFPGLTNAYRLRAEAKTRAGDQEAAELDLATYYRLGGRDLPAYE
jgi:tetratricopeptide (TPR) repeat protein